AHVDLIGCAGLDGPERGECPQAVRAAKAVGRRVVGDAVAGSDAPQRGGLAVADLHEPLASAEPNMLGRRHRNPVLPAHGAAGANTRRRWPSGSSATKVVPKSIFVGTCAMLSPRLLQSA